jgi:exopolysaccharide biosynthesis polyprenyl glycosylphosphotransferase
VHEAGAAHGRPSKGEDVKALAADIEARGVLVPPLRSFDRPRYEAPRLVPSADEPSSPSVLFGAQVAMPGRDSVRRRMLAGADLLGLLCAYGVVLLAAPPATSPNGFWLVGALPAWILLNKILRLYDRDANLIHKSTLNELPTIVQSISLGAALAFMFGPLLGGASVERPQVITFWAVACVLTPAFRYAARGLVRRSTPPERVLIVGSGHVAGLVARKLEQHPEYGAEITGYVDVPDGENVRGDGITRLGGVQEFEAVCREHDVERVVIAFSSLAHENLLDMIRVSKRLHLKISVVPRLFEVIGHSVEIDQIEGMTLLGLRGLTRTHSTLLLKRGVDIVGAGFLLLLAAPVMLAAALAVKLTSPGPVMFVQRRVGRQNKAFPMFKFRTMVVGADAMKADLEHLNEMPGTMFKIADDPRTTAAGRWLRPMSIDELPQLFNVLRGEMSLVGPRPLVPDESDHIIGWHRARLDLTPGLTGPWQVMGRNAIPFDEMVKLDYLYVSEWSLWNDFKLLARTLPVVVGRRGT